MALSPGTRIGHYDVTALLGEGGMGQVWRATDTQLNRQVALKILPDTFASDPDRLARFTREAQILASLNHPNIGSIYGLEEGEGGKFRALVLELVEGPTLADRIKQGPVPLDEALPIAKQIAEALEAAHEQGVIHRDLKPANIKVREDGTVKVLDFGLAKAFQPDASDQSDSPTMTVAATQQGMVLGTAAYMSPEQAKGKTADRRADIWAFGCVLYELLTGTSPFTGDNVSEILAGVIKSEPHLEALPDATPARLRQVVRRCLEKEPRERVQAIGDVRLAMDGAFETPASPTGAPTPAGSRRLTPVVTFVAGILLAGGAFWGLTDGQPTAPGRVIRYVVAPPDGYLIGPNSGEALSPDGHRLVYSATDAGGLRRLFLLERDQVDAVPLAGTEDGSQPFFSPDGAWIGFAAGTALKTLSLAGGPANTLATGDTIVLGAAWGPDDTIAYNFGDGLLEVDTAGGDPRRLTTPAAGENHVGPRFLPDGSGIVFTLSTGPSIEEKQLALFSRDTGEHETLIAGTQPQVLPTGHLLFGRAGSLWAAAFDHARGEITGPAVLVVDDLQVNVPGGWAHYAVAADGTLAYLPSTGVSSPTQLVWVDRQGLFDRAPVSGLGSGRLLSVALSSAGDRLAVTLNSMIRDELWTYDVGTQTPTRLTIDGRAPLWSPDGDYLVYFSTEAGREGLHRQRWDGSGEAELLYRPAGATALPQAWLPDGSALVFDERDETMDVDINLLSMDAEHVVTALVATEFNEGGATFAPNGRWIAYSSDRSGVDEVYVRPFPGLDRLTPISTGGGLEPRWGPDGRELFYRRPDGELHVVAVDTDAGEIVVESDLVFEGVRPGALLEGLRTYDIDPSGARVISIAFTRGSDAQGGLIIVENWIEELRERVPIP